MIGNLLGIGLTILLSACLWLISQRSIPAWNSAERGISNLPWSWQSIFAVSSAMAIISYATSVLLGATPIQGAAVSVVAWLTPFVTATDYVTYKIPKETSIVAYYIPLPLMIAHSVQIHSWAPIAAFGVWTICVFLLFLFAAGKGIGMGDIRLLLVFGSTLSWWIGIENMIYALCLACLIQIIVFPIAAALGKGQLMEKGKFNDDAEEKEQKSLEKTPAKVKLRRHLPFGPVLMYSFLAVAIYMSIKSPDACDAFLLLLCS